MKITKFTKRMNPITYWVIATCVATALALSWVVVVDKAYGQCAFNNPDGSCFSASQLAKKFRNGKIEPAHGFDPKAEFAHPKAARKFFVHEIAVKFNHLSPTRQLKIRVALGASRDPFICDATCVAEQEYNRTVNASSCVGDDLYHGLIPGICVPDNHHPFTKAGIQAAGSIVFCGSLVVIGIAGAPETGGGSGYLAAFVGAGACGWFAWSAIDPG